MKVIQATDDSYLSLVKQPGYTLVFIDSEQSYGGRERNLRDARRLAREQAEWLCVIRVVREECPQSVGGYGPGTFLLFLDGDKISGISLTNRLTQVVPWLAKCCP